MSDEATQLREAIRKIRTEVDCRISHGAESFGHLEYVQEQLDKALAIPVRGCQSGTHEHHQTSMSPELKERINSAIVDPNSIAEEIGEAPCGIGHLRYVEAEFVESLAEELSKELLLTREAAAESDRISSQQISSIAAERDELRRWKAEALVVLNQLNLQKLGEMLNVPIGQSVSEHLLPAVSALLAKLEKAQDIIRELDDRESDDESIATLATAHVELLQKNRTELLALVDSLRKLVDSLRNEVRLAWQEGHTSGYRCASKKPSVDYIDSRARRISENFPP